MPVFVFLLVCNWLNATNVSGSQGDSTWTLAKSPYVITGNVTLQAGKTLTIQARVVEQFPFTDGQNSALIVNGTLTAIGTVANNIRFTGGKRDQCCTDRSGPVFTTDSSTNSRLENVTIDQLRIRYRDNLSGLVVVSTTSCTITNCIIKNTRGTGILINKGNPVISNNIFSGNVNGIYAQKGSGPAVSNNIFTITVQRLALEVFGGETGIERSFMMANSRHKSRNVLPCSQSL